MFYPALFETDSWYDNIAVVTPFWAYSDEYVMENLRDEFPEAATKVYYHEYTASFESDVQTRTVLAKAKADVADSGMRKKPALVLRRNVKSNFVL